jgi:hypothetical protein
MSTISDLQRMLREYKRSNPYGYSNLKKKYIRRDNVLLKSGYYNNQTWGALIKCWKGYMIAKNDGDEEKMIHYAEGIQKFQCELGVDVEDFSHLGLCAPSSSPHEAIAGQDEASNRFEHGTTYDDALNINDKEYEFDDYEDYANSLPMGIEPISKDEFYKRHN